MDITNKPTPIELDKNMSDIETESALAGKFQAFDTRGLLAWRGIHRY